MVIASPRSTHRSLAPVPTEMDDDREHRKMLAQATLQLQERARNLPIGVTSVSANYTMIDTDGLILMSASGGARTVTLLSAAGRTGREITVKKTDSSSNAVTIDAAGSETLDGSATVTLDQQHDARTYRSDGSNWRLIATAGLSSFAGLDNALSVEILADAPIGYWKCNDTSGTTLEDSSGNNFDLTIVGTPTLADSYLVPTDNDKYLRVKGTGDGAELVSKLGTTPPLTGNWAFECIVKTESYTTNIVRVMSFGLNTSELEVNNVQASFFFAATTGNAGVFWEHSAGTDVVVARSPATTPNTFGASIYAVEKDGTANTVTFYLNGKKFADAVAYANEPTGGSGSIKFCIGYDGNNTQNFVIAHASFYTTLPGAARWWAHAQAAGLAAF